MSLLSVLVDMEEEMEARRDSVYSRLEKLTKRIPRHLNDRTRKRLWSHLSNFNLGYEWVEEGEELLEKARIEKVEEYRKMSGFVFDEPEDYLYDDTYFDHYDDLVEEWDRWLFVDSRAAKRNCAEDEDGAKTYHRTGLKRDKTEFWNRPLTRWHRHHKLRRQQQEAKKAKKRRQNDHQPQM